jgi:hypothetical protein
MPARAVCVFGRRQQLSPALLGAPQLDAAQQAHTIMQPCRRIANFASTVVSAAVHLPVLEQGPKGVVLHSQSTLHGSKGSCSSFPTTYVVAGQLLAGCLWRYVSARSCKATHTTTLQYDGDSGVLRCTNGQGDCRPPKGVLPFQSHKPSMPAALDRFAAMPCLGVWKVRARTSCCRSSHVDMYVTGCKR